MVDCFSCLNVIFQIVELLFNLTCMIKYGKMGKTKGNAFLNFLYSSNFFLSFHFMYVLISNGKRNSEMEVRSNRRSG